MSNKHNILFICGSNSCRSQIAEGWAHYLYPEKFNPFSAGIETQPIDKLAIKVMKEVGVDISTQETHAVGDFLYKNLDLVITVCSDAAAERCPIFPEGVKVVSHPFDNPVEITREMKNEEEKLAVYRRVRDEIRSYVEQLANSLA